MDRPRTPFSSSNNIGFVPQLHTDAHCFVCHSAHSYILRLGGSKDGRKGSYNNTNNASDHLTCRRWTSRSRGALCHWRKGRGTVIGTPGSGTLSLGSILGPGTPQPCDTRQAALPDSPVSLFTEDLSCSFALLMGFLPGTLGFSTHFLGRHSNMAAVFSCLNINLF